MHYTPPPSPRPRTLSRKIAMFGCLPIAVLFGAVLALGAAVDDDTDTGSISAKPSAPAATSAKPTTKPAKPAAPAKTTTPGLSKRDITKLSVDMVWNNYSNARRDLLCIGIEVNGPGWFADQMTSDNVDREYAGQLVEEKCANR